MGDIFILSAFWAYITAGAYIAGLAYGVSDGPLRWRRYLALWFAWPVMLAYFYLVSAAIRALDGADQAGKEG